MGTSSDKLQAILNSKNAIKNAINSKGGNVGDVLSTYAQAILNLQTGGGEQPELYPVQISLQGTNLTINDTTNGSFGDGYLLYGNGTQVENFETTENEFTVDLRSVSFPAVSTYSLTVTIYDRDNFKNSISSNAVSYVMPGYYLEGTTAHFQVDYTESPNKWYPGGNTATLI